jgi:hypothetical protein
MSRKTRTDPAVEDAQAPVIEEADLHGFWDRTKIGDESDDAFASVVDVTADAASEAETLAYMGNVTQVEPDELTELAGWAESKACRACRRKILEHHDPALLRHDECRHAVRVGRILRRYE